MSRERPSLTSPVKKKSQNIIRVNEDELKRNRYNDGCLPQRRHYLNAPCQNANEPFQDDDRDCESLFPSCGPSCRRACCQRDYFDPYLYLSAKTNFIFN